MVMDIEQDRVAAVIRNEVVKYFDGHFSDDDNFIEDMHILSDDLTAISLAVEKKLSLKLYRNEYRTVTNVSSYTLAVLLHLSNG
jgi:hypothetical protein